MSASQFVPKSVLFEELRTIFLEKNSAMLSLLTETKRSVLMRFSNGRLTSARCRSWEIENTIEALAETETVKYSLILSSVQEDKPTLMEAEAFWGMINPLGGPLETMVKMPPQPEKPLEPQVNIDGNIIQPESEEPEEEDPFAVDKAQAAKMNFF